MAFVKIDRKNMQIRLIYPTNLSAKKVLEYEEELNNYPIKIIPQNTITDEQMRQTIISLYYRNKETGELMPEGRLIDVKTLLNNPYKTLTEMLIEDPRNNKLESAIPKETVINKVELKDEQKLIKL